MQQNISTGTPVTFDSEHGPQRGTVSGIKRDVTNAQQWAVVEIDHDLPGILMNVPLDKLQVRV